MQEEWGWFAINILEGKSDMTAIPLKRIEGALVRDVHENCDCEDGEGCRYFADSVEDFIQKQGEVKISLSREKLVKLLNEGVNVGKPFNEIYCPAYIELISDAILNALPELMEVVK